MSLRSYIPTRGEKTTRRKIKELEKEAGSLPVMFGVFVTKIFESVVAGRLMLALNFTGASIAVALLYIYSKELAEKAKDTAEKAKETVTEEEE